MLTAASLRQAMKCLEAAFVPSEPAPVISPTLPHDFIQMPIVQECCQALSNRLFQSATTAPNSMHSLAQPPGHSETPHPAHAVPAAVQTSRL